MKRNFDKKEISNESWCKTGMRILGGCKWRAFPGLYGPCFISMKTWIFLSILYDTYATVTATLTIDFPLICNTFKM